MMTKREKGRKLVKDKLAESGIYPEDSEIRVIANNIIDWTKPLPKSINFDVEITDKVEYKDYTWEKSVLLALGYEVSEDYISGWFYNNPKYAKRTSAFVEIILSLGLGDTRDDCNYKIADLFDSVGAIETKEMFNKSKELIDFAKSCSFREEETTQQMFTTIYSYVYDNYGKDFIKEGMNLVHNRG